MALIGYARVSSDTQSIDLQINELKKCGCTKIYKDVASGRIKDREGLVDMLNYLRDGDTVIVWKIDRLGRSTANLISTIETLINKGVKLRSITEPIIDTTTPIGKAIVSLISIFSELELTYLKERTAAGIIKAKNDGVQFGRPPKITPEMAKKIERYLEMELNITEISRVLNIGRTTIYKAIESGKINCNTKTKKEIIKTINIH